MVAMASIGMSSHSQEDAPDTSEAENASAAAAGQNANSAPASRTLVPLSRQLRPNLSEHIDEQFLSWCLRSS